VVAAGASGCGRAAAARLESCGPPAPPLASGREPGSAGFGLIGLRERLRSRIFAELDEVYVNGSMEHRLPGNMNISFNFVEGEGLMMAIKDVAVSSGSACTSSSLEPSYVLRALGVGDELAHSGFTLGRIDLSVQIFAGDDVGGGHRPVFRDFDVFLLEDNPALSVGDGGSAQFPFDFVVRRDAGLGKEAAHLQAGGLFRGFRGRRSGDRRGGGGFGRCGFQFRHEGSLSIIRFGAALARFGVPTG